MLLENLKRTSEKQPTGRIVGVIKRNWRAYVVLWFLLCYTSSHTFHPSYVCHIDSTSLTSSNATSLSQQTVFATPVSRLLPRIRLRTRQAPTLIGQKILVTIDRWDATSRYPEGHFVRALGKVESKEAEQESLLLEFEVPYRPFGKAILDCLPVEGDKWVVPPKAEMSPDWRDREDLRELIICSIDPPSEPSLMIFSGFEVHDYFSSFYQIVKTLMMLCMLAIYQMEISKQASVSLRTFLHPFLNNTSPLDIADVSHFVHPDTPMDNEAAGRGTTVYLVDKRIDMLPSLLGTNLCSLRPFVERLAFSAIWVCSPFFSTENI